jgi:tetratricopeptide (TPR) repeat protein
LRAQAALQRRHSEESAEDAQRALDAVVRSPLRAKFRALEADAALRLGQAQQALGELPRARANLERALELRRADDAPQSPWLAEAQLALASCLLDLGQHARARALVAEAAAIEAAHPELGQHLTLPLHQIGARSASR